MFWGHLSMTPVKDEAGYIRAIIAIVQDINERKLLEDKLESMAHYDALTGLPNRALFFDRLSQAIAQTRRSQGQFALMFVDLDGFKAVNDTFGHDTGDALLKAVAEHLLECVRESDTVARLGGDEFVVLVADVKSINTLAQVAQKILDTLALSYDLGPQRIHSTASIGVSVYPDDHADPDLLLQYADNAMYEAKRSPGGGYRFFHELN